MTSHSTQYGAAELGQPIGVASSAGRAHRRQLVVAAGVAAAVVLCCVGIAAGARHSAIVTMGDSPSNTLGEFSLGSVLNQMRPVRGRTTKPVQQAKYGYMDAPSPHYDSYLGEQANYLHNQQTLGLSPALNRARQSQQDMTSLVNYYAQRSPALNPSAYSSESSYPSLVDGYNTLDHASTVWDEHAQHLNELNEEIMRQQNTLHRMNMGERLLSSRHEQIKTEISKLMSASAEVSSQLEELKGQYSVQINDLKAQYKDLAKALKKEKEAAQDELTKNIKEQNKLRDEIQEAMQKDAYYGTQARHAEEDVENYRNRAKDWEAEEKQNRIDVKTWEDVSADQNIKEQDARAGKKAAEVEEQASLDISKIKARAAAVNTARHAKAITIEAQARVEDALQNAGLNAAEAAAEEEEEAKKTLEDYDDKKAVVMDKVLVEKGEQATARVEETQAKMLMVSAKRKYNKIMSEIKRVTAERKASLQVANAAEAKTAAVETEGKIAELMSASAAALAGAHAEAGEKTIAAITDKMGMGKEQEDDADSKKEGIMAALLSSLGEKLDFDNEAKFVNGRAAIADGHAKTTLESATRHRDEAKNLLGSVNELARLAKQAAEVAAAERIKAQADAISSGVPCMHAACMMQPPPAVASISNPSIHVHVVPNSAS
mmetsp:Transcript_10804/g.17065  ORF Transcript_10804/g.17065 Transcript_10804/m.17065 type:complete len:659 (+) Transcript_10804:67-2043(+)